VVPQAAQALNMSYSIVTLLWQHRRERYVRFAHPDFEAKAADVIGLCFHPAAGNQRRPTDVFICLLEQLNDPLCVVRNAKQP
jgi:hypothetical protein